MSENVYYVYIHRRNDTNEVFYVGKGKGSRYKHNYGRNIWWKAVVNKCGFSYEIVEKELFESDAFDLEVELIKFYKECGCQLVNMTNGGEGLSGRIPSEETRKKMSQAGKDRIFSDTHRENLSAAGRGRWQSQQTRDKISRSKMGRIATPEENARKSLIAKRTPMVCSNGMAFVSLLAASQWLLRIGLSKNKGSANNVAQCCKGRRPTAFGFKWSYIEVGIMEEYMAEIVYENDYNFKGNL